jgi:hypothetical protein
VEEKRSAVRRLARRRRWLPATSGLSATACTSGMILPGGRAGWPRKAEALNARALQNSRSTCCSPTVRCSSAIWRRRRRQLVGRSCHERKPCGISRRHAKLLAQGVQSNLQLLTFDQLLTFRVAQSLSLASEVHFQPLTFDHAFGALCCPLHRTRYDTLHACPRGRCTKLRGTRTEHAKVGLRSGCFGLVPKEVRERHRCGRRLESVEVLWWPVISWGDRALACRHHGQRRWRHSAGTECIVARSS